jgi:hypothetical protein
MSTPALQFAISLIFVYLLLSALSSAIQEIIANLVKWRSNTLETAITNLLGDSHLKDSIYDHALVKGILRPSWLFTKVERMHKPSYISSAIFAQVLQDLRTTGTSMPAQTQKVLNVILQGATNAEEERKKIEKWFDDAMDNVSGWYKRKAHAWLCVISFGVCIAINADTIAIGKVLWNDPSARAAMSDAAKKYVDNAANQNQQKQGANATATQITPTEQVKNELQGVVQARNNLNNLAVPLGWCKASAADCSEDRQWPTGDEWFLKVLGILITVLAVSQGAPFWFDLLQKVVNLRLAGDPPQDSRKQPATN